MIHPLKFIHCLSELNSSICSETTLISGVPDSLLKEFCAELIDPIQDILHVGSVNEGSAIAIAAGYHLATGGIPLVYMQNSGLGNATNPLLSLTDIEVYAIPMILLIGMRGKPGEYDEPQHTKQGAITGQLLDVMGIPQYTITSSMSEEAILNGLMFVHRMTKESGMPVAILVEKDVFEKSQVKVVPTDNMSGGLSREQALEEVVNCLPQDAIVVSTTGKLSRELFELRERTGGNHSQDFLTVGSMGHASSIALGIALSNPNKKVYCLDGDGALLMHMGVLSTISTFLPKNLYHIIFNNEAHESVGGQPTYLSFDLADTVDAISSNCICTYFAKTKEQIRDAVCSNNIKSFTRFLEIQINCASRSNLGRPTISPIDNKKTFMKTLQNKL